MRINNQVVMYTTLIVLALSCICCLTNAALLQAKAHQKAHLKVKRSPYLRLDELSTNVYLAKELGGGLVDPLEIGKRSGGSASYDEKESDLAFALYDGLIECLERDKCFETLSSLLNKNNLI